MYDSLGLESLRLGPGVCSCLHTHSQPTGSGVWVCHTRYTHNPVQLDLLLNDMTIGLQYGQCPLSCSNSFASPCSGNPIRVQLLRYNDVLFAGYRLPHPLETKLALKIHVIFPVPQSSHQNSCTNSSILFKNIHSWDAPPSLPPSPTLPPSLPTALLSLSSSVRRKTIRTHELC